MILRALLYYLFAPVNKANVNTCPAEGVDLRQYLGRWYELARFETPFEKGLEEVFTEYRMQSDGNISISNYGRSMADGKRREAHAIGSPADSGRMCVSFIPWLRFLCTSYNILAVDEFYRNALVSNNTGTCLWFLSRCPQIVPDDFERLKSEALRRGFDLSALHYTQHRYR